MNKNTVELLGYYGGDQSHALSAWTSTRRELDNDRRDRIGSLLKMLAQSGHHSPFEKSLIHFLVTCDTASHIHILKHRIGVSCVTGDTLVYIPRPTSSGHNSSGFKTRSIQKLYDEYNFGIQTRSSRGNEYWRKYGRLVPVRSKDLESNLIKKDYIENVFYNGQKEVYKFTTADNKSITTTLDHEFFTPEGWQQIGPYLSVGRSSSGRAHFKNNDNWVAVNGEIINDPTRPWTDRDFFLPIEGVMTRVEASEYLGINYNTLKKWGYIHGISFKKDENNFEKGNIPWNLNRYGYKLNRKTKKKGLRSSTIIDRESSYSYRVWRASVGNWTREQLPKLLVKFNYHCQGPLAEHSRNWNCHHIVPVSYDKSLALEFDNLSLICEDCHRWIHRSEKNTRWFIEHHKGKELVDSLSYQKKPLKERKLAIGFETVVHVEYMGVQDVYDLKTKLNANYVANGFIIHNCNAESARYKEHKEDKYYIPDDWPEDLKQKIEGHIEQSYSLYHNLIEKLQERGYDRKRAKESARFALSYASQLNLDVSFNFRSFMHFQGLRNKPDAQKEIREIADKMLLLVKETGAFDFSLAGFGYE